MNEEKKAEFAIGQLVHHRLFDYRGVIFDVDPDFQGSEESYERQARTGSPPKDEPWYHVLIDDDARIAYVAQRNLEVDSLKAPIDHPLLSNFFNDFKAGHYRTRQTYN